MKEKKEPDYYRHRMELIEHLIMKYNHEARTETDPEKKKKAERNVEILYRGVFPEGYKQFAKTNNIPLIPERLRKTLLGNHPLSFYEQIRFNTWFVLHPEKIAGKEYISTSRDFPIRVQGTKQDVINTIRSNIRKRENSSINGLRTNRDIKTKQGTKLGHSTNENREPDDMQLKKARTRASTLRLKMLMLPLAPLRKTSIITKFQ